VKEKESSPLSDVKPADAIGTISNRTRASRFSIVIVAVVGFFVLAFFVGLLLRTIFDKSNTPDIPSVELSHVLAILTV